MKGLTLNSHRLRTIGIAALCMVSISQVRANCDNTSPPSSSNVHCNGVDNVSVNAAGQTHVTIDVATGASVDTTDRTIQIGSSSTLINAGTLTSNPATNGRVVIAIGDANSITNDGAIVGGGESGGLAVLGDSNRITNRGAITVNSNLDFRVGVLVTGMNNKFATNDQIAVSGPRSIAMLLSDSLGFRGTSGATNFGSMNAQGGDALAVRIDTRNSVYAVFNNAVGGEIVNDGGIAIQGIDSSFGGSGGSSYILNAGHIRGLGTAIDLGPQFDVMYVTETSTVEGLDNGGSGTDILFALGRGNGSFDSDTVGVQYVHFEQFVISTNTPTFRPFARAPPPLALSGLKESG